MTTSSQETLKIPGLLAGAALTAAQYKWMKLASTAGEVIVAAAKTDLLIGVLQNNPADGQPADVLAVGVSKVLSGGSVTLGVLQTANSTGQTADASSANDRVGGYALATDGTATNLVRVFVNCASNF